MVRKSTVRIPLSGKRLNWHKEDQRKIRRQNALNSRHGDLMQTYHALNGLSRVTRDSETKRLAKADAVHFLEQHKKKQALKSKTRRR
jgi:hypothetical protein